MTNVELYYFSGTGNSLYVAKELQKRIPETTLIPIVSLLNKDTILTDVEVVGFVFPTYGLTIPMPVKHFLKKLDVESSMYLFAVTTRAGSKCLGISKIEKILKEKGKALDAYFVLTMPDNNPKFETYRVQSKDEFAKTEAQTQERLDFMQKIIVNRERYRGKNSHAVPVNYVVERLALLGMMYAEYDGVNDYFYSDSKCRGCGTCEKVCLSSKIKMENGKPTWQTNTKCFTCYACLNYCPSRAVQIKTKWYMKSYTEKNGRYPHPYATADDIRQQKGGNIA